MPIDGEQALPFAELVGKGPASRLWTGQSLFIDPHSVLASAAGAGARVPVGTSVALMPLSHPFQAALQARSLAALTGHPVVVGLGTGPEPFVKAMLGSTYRSPLGAVREYASIVRALLDGQVCASSGDYYSARGGLPPMDAPACELGLGVLRPRMAELAGELADVAVTWLTPPCYLGETIVPALARGAERAGRPRPRVAAVVHVSPDAPGRDHVRTVLSCSRPHLQAPHYADTLRGAGVPVTPDDLRGTTERLISSRTVAVGSTEEILTTLFAYREAGVDEVILSAFGIQAEGGTEASRHALGAVLDAVAAAERPALRSPA
ncbi:LLM class flavin-dependent oxidoreductase [Streptomyces sp. NPDC058239]|uniref:LLM class flavin-dependent oxidoreductase n=1 Tax=Streptomyces sp. NPDC058239 TaxID=3346395 RepID=UPI0036EB1702